VRDYSTLLTRVKSALTSEQDATVDFHEVSVDGKGYPLVKIVLGKRRSRTVLLAAGIHGDEPSGVEAICEFVIRKCHAQFLRDWQLTLLPCLNPWGYEHGTRENQLHKDLNREFDSNDPLPEVAFAQSAFQHPFDLILDLHEDSDSPGYYVYQCVGSEQEKEAGRVILENVATSMPVNMHTEIDGRPADRGVIERLCKPDSMSGWPMPIYALTKGARRYITLEASSNFPMEVRVNAHLLALEAALTYFSRMAR
jgi:predicted deacylase